MRAIELLTEAVTKRPWTFYHGSKSHSFDTFDPSLAAKGEQHWNPLGDGMYVTNNPRFASNFGSNVHIVTIPAGSTYKRINLRMWQYQTGFGLCVAALKKAFKMIGDSYTAWEKGIKPPLPFDIAKLDRTALIAELVKTYLDQPAETIQTAAAKHDDETLRRYLKARVAPRYQSDPAKSKKLFEFRYQTNYHLRQNDPYTGLYESLSIVANTFENNDLTEAYAKALSDISNRKFGKFDFVVFTETNDPFTFNDDEVTSEVVIYNPALQRTSGEYHR